MGTPIERKADTASNFNHGGKTKNADGDTFPRRAMLAVINSSVTLNPGISVDGVVPEGGGRGDRKARPRTDKERHCSR